MIKKVICINVVIRMESLIEQNAGQGSDSGLSNLCVISCKFVLKMQNYI